MPRVRRSRPRPPPAVLNERATGHELASEAWERVAGDESREILVVRLRRSQLVHDRTIRVGTVAGMWCDLTPRDARRVARALLRLARGR